MPTTFFMAQDSFLGEIKKKKTNYFLQVKHQKVDVSGEMKGLHLSSHYLN